MYSLSTSNAKKSITCKEHRREPPLPVPAPIYHRSPTASLCCTTIPPWSPWHTQHLGLSKTLACIPLVPLLQEPLTLNNGVDGTALLAESAVDALCHIDVVSCRPPAAIFALLGFDGNGLSGADGLA